MMQSLTVDLGERSYPILVGGDLLGATQSVRQFVKGKQVVVVSNPTVADLYADNLLSSLSDLQADLCLVDDGEQHKTLATYNTVLDFLFARGHNRSTTVVALGGGVVGDLAGFVAATYQRGVAFVQVPTTLLAQVDSSVGGKTAVNHPVGKNLVGAFYQPQAVLADISVLRTLPARELRAGLAEVIKYGLIAERAFFDFVVERADDLLSLDQAALTEAVLRSCAAKARVVQEDEREGGRRMILNFGHTFGHAIEKLLGFGEMLHGEAVGLGMVMAADLSWRMGLLHQEEALEVKRAIAALQLPTQMPQGLHQADMLDAFSMDKKTVDGKLRFILISRIGEAVISDQVNRELLVETLAAQELCGGSG